MANIKRINGKTGISYKITVAQGRDSNGKQVRHYKTWIPPQGMTERQMEKEIQKVAFEFEQQIEQGFIADNRQTFEQYAEYVLQLKERAGAKHRTLERYKSLLERIIPALGHLKLVNIRPQHLNMFYANLSEEGIRQSQVKATPKKDIAKIAKDKGFSVAQISRLSGIAASTISPVMRGKNVALRTADAVSSALGYKTETLFKLSQDTTPLANKTILEYHRLISTILSVAEKEMIIPYNPARRATPPKPAQKEAECFQPEEIVQILECLEDEPIRWRTITHLLIVTGCRRGEIMGLHWKSIDWDNNQICIERALLYSPDIGIYEDTTKTSETRYIKLPAETMQLLKQYRIWQIELQFNNGDRWHATDYVFTRDNGEPLNPDSITQWLNNFAKRHNLSGVHPHKFRHTSASLLISNGIDIVAVSKRLGHAKVSTTTDIYSHIIKQADTRAADCIADTLLRKQA